MCLESDFLIRENPSLYRQKLEIKIRQHLLWNDLNNKWKMKTLIMVQLQCLKVTMEAQLGLIGGTMGLLTGFSILSGVEILYYLIRCRCLSQFVTERKF